MKQTTNTQTNIQNVHIMIGNGCHNGLTHAAIDYLRSPSGARNFEFSQGKGPYNLLISGDSPEFLAFTVQGTDNTIAVSFLLHVKDLCKDLGSEDASLQAFVDASFSDCSEPSESKDIAKRFDQNERHQRLLEAIKRRLSAQGIEISKEVVNSTFAIGRLVTIMREEISPTDRALPFIPGLGRRFG